MKLILKIVLKSSKGECMKTFEIIICATLYVAMLGLTILAVIENREDERDAE